ncbi:MAG: type II 3-dehydroquinate dehydratase [Clostridia bacterium]|nr:type II 3-dehydroquinate dehydratase [Clostridia bacterium]
MKILVINGPSINMLGVREPNIYGSKTYDDLCSLVEEECKKKGVLVDFFQSNHEGDIVDIILNSYKKTDAIIINPAAYTHTSIAIADALNAVSIPYVEVHISDVSKREEYRQISFIRENAVATVMGEGISGYVTALNILLKGR